MDYRLVLSNLKFVEFHFLVTVDSYISCHVALGEKCIFDLSVLDIQ